MSETGSEATRAEDGISKEERILLLPATFLAGAALLALADAIAVVATVPLPSGGAALRAEHHLFDAAEIVGVGLVAAAIATALAFAIGRRRWLGMACGGVASVFFTWKTIGENAMRAANVTMPSSVSPLMYLVYVIGIGSLVPTAYLISLELAASRRTRFIPIAAALAGLVIDHVILVDDYQGMHGFLAAGIAVVFGAAVAVPVARRLLHAGKRPLGRLALGAVAAFGISGVVVPPPNLVRHELFRIPCAVAPWVLATTLWRPPSVHAPPPASPPSPWARDRSADPPVPPSEPGLLPSDAVVVMITIDATRADVVLDPAKARMFPVLTEMQRNGVVFENATAAASQTPLSLASLFSGRTFSEQLWQPYSEGKTRFLYPANDTSVRFPEVLSQHGVATFDVGTLVFMSSDFGVLRGFGEEHMVTGGTRHAMAAEAIGPLVARLHRAQRGPMFVYTHLMEPHEPYDRGRKDGTDFERYESEISVADEYVGQVLRALKRKFPGKWALIVSADHGEAFGDHETTGHAKSLYQELVHVPLLIDGATIHHRRVSERVSLVDMGPTILDLFGLPTPPTFLGQSLTPFLVGKDPELTRPIFAEGRLRRSMTSKDGWKIIEDLRRKTAEIYDLNRDPGELDNLFDKEPARADELLTEMRAFFAAHTRTQGGYVPPFSP